MSVASLEIYESFLLCHTGMLGGCFDVNKRNEGFEVTVEVVQEAHE